MTRLVTLAFTAMLALTITLQSGCQSDGPGTHFGNPMQLQTSSAVKVEKVLANPTMYEGKRLMVVGYVNEVCAAKGCWLRMAPKAGSDDTLFVKFRCPIKGRLIPMEAKGHKVAVEGELEITTVPEAQARHYAEDSGKSPEEIAKIVGEQQMLKLSSPAAVVYGLPKAEAKNKA